MKFTWQDTLHLQKFSWIILQPYYSSGVRWILLLPGKY
jgi:hypothetical protein